MVKPPPATSSGAEVNIPADMTPEELLYRARTLLVRHGLMPALPSHSRETTDARAESLRTRQMFADIKAKEISEHTRLLGAISSDDLLLWPLRRLADHLRAANVLSPRGYPLTPTAVRRALERSGIRTTKPT